MMLLGHEMSATRGGSIPHAGRPAWGKVATVGECEQLWHVCWVIVLAAAAGGCVGPGVDSAKKVSVGTAPTPSITAPPFSEAGAAGALAASSRQSEWVQVKQPGSDQPIATWVVRPEHQDSASVVLVIHEIFGVTDWVRAVADRLAENGFIALVPDLVSGLGPDGGGTASVASRHQVAGLIRGLQPAEKVARLAAIRDYATRLPSTTGLIAVVGFSWGGSVGFSYAVAMPHLQAAVVYYGRAPVESADYEFVETPVLGLYGGDDESVNATITIAEREMARRGTQFIAEVFAGAGHGFLRAQESHDGANRVASELAWRRTIEFLRQYLGV